ncbi:hypothetical protein D0869_12071 [Hortaea werneckii]|uniref:Inactive metallocarboxypeptidase ECM14 n=2 Tax=Hortaea werneckii TaxID=91943 RepID=A0A3M6W910_HORWE|nr:hypothetical protein KC324_g13711 [Hortaea werneckii]KAI7555575.1 hypothetical protein KC316_g13771 [Hortaea werneckii]RMX74968.1 hypothetical protein D0869_12071 [Hortaea werneckii]
MRLSCAALLALPATFLSTLAVAVPSPAYPDQHPFSLSPSTPERSRWRKLSGKLIDTVWGLTHNGHGPTAKMAKAEAQAPPHTFARYGGDVVLRFNISTHDEAKSLADAADTLLLDVWEFTQDWVDIRLAKDIVGPLLGLLPSSLQSSHAPLLGERDLAQAIYDTYPQPRGVAAAHPKELHHTGPSLGARPFSPALGQDKDETNIFFNDYQPFSVIEPWMRLMASLFTTHVRKVNIGVSAQGRDIPGLRVGVHPTNNQVENPPKRKTVLIFGGQHAREWISTSTVTYLAYSFITGYGKSPSITRILEAFDIIFIPTINPDGYIYTWETDRLWRKNRQPTNLRFCQGIDLDRNFGFQWDGDHSTTAGNPCSESFAGDRPFQAVETQQLAAWAQNETEHHNVDFVALLDLHSYSQQILYPYSYSCDDMPANMENLEELAFGLAKAIRVGARGHNYEVLSACEGNSILSASSSPATDDDTDASTPSRHHFLPRIVPSGGSALDWFYAALSVRFAYQVKLPDRGMYGFLLPREMIVPTGKEMLDALLYLGEFLGETFGVEGLGVRGDDDGVVEGDSEGMGFKQDESVAPQDELEEEEVLEEGLGEDGKENDDDEAEWIVIEGSEYMDDESEGEDVRWDLKRRMRRR